MVTRSASEHSSPGGNVLPGSFTLLATDEFVAELDQRLASARRTVAIQLMTFDGDAAGQAVAQRLLDAAGRGVHVRLLVDCFALRFVSDQPVGRPAVRAEQQATLDMFRQLRSAGVELRFTHPNGPLNVYALARNHKKLFVIDDVAYLGGINISDHNFSWHDFMLRIDDQRIRQEVLADFDITFAGRRQTVELPAGALTAEASGLTASRCRGWVVTNAATEKAFDQLISLARHRLVVASPYALDRRLAAVVAASPARSKTAVIAARNNFRFLRSITPYLVHRLRRSGVDLASYRRFSHSKFLVVDSEWVLIGSSNFGRHSFWCNQEIGLVIRDPGIARQLESPLVAEVQPLESCSSRGLIWWGWLATALMDAALRVYARLVAPRVTPVSIEGR